MCEFNVFLDGEKVMEDVIFAKRDGANLSVSDIIGETRVFEDVDIIEVNVPSSRLTLKSR